MSPLILRYLAGRFHWNRSIGRGSGANELLDAPFAFGWVARPPAAFRYQKMPEFMRYLCGM
jgi:hypothetical protein